MYPIEFFWRAAARFPDRIAVIDPVGAISFGELAVSVAALARAFQALDPTPDGRVGIGAANGRAHLIALLATLAAGRTWVPLNPRAGTAGLRSQIVMTAPGILVLDNDMLPRLADCSGVVVALEGGSEHALPGLIRQWTGGRPLPVQRPLSDAQAVKFTGGTTGKPKGVMQPMRAWNTMIVSQIHAFGFHSEDRFVLSAPLTHGSSTYVLPVLGMGGCLVFPEETRPSAILDSIAKHGATTLFLPPILVDGLARENTLRRRSLTSLTRIIYGAAPMSPANIREAEGSFGPVLATTYGQTEAPQIITFLGQDELLREENMGSVGRPSLLTEVMIAAPDGSPVAPGEEGEVLVRGDLVMGGYWDAPEHTARTIVDGWLHTGDVGRMDARDFLFLKGRKDDVIITGGFNVHPADVEAVLATHPDVAQCVVLGVPDAKWGEAVHAVIVPPSGCTADTDAMGDFLKGEIGSVMTPKYFHIVDQLPKTAVDKISRAALRQMIVAGPVTGGHS